jgi:hypothetical protein
MGETHKPMGKWKVVDESGNTIYETVVEQKANATWQPGCKVYRLWQGLDDQWRETGYERKQ